MTFRQSQFLIATASNSWRHWTSITVVFILQIIRRRHHVTRSYRPMASTNSSQRLKQHDVEECVMHPEPDTSNISYPKHAFRTVTSVEAAGKITMTSAVMVLALVGNCLVVTTVWRCRRLRTPTNVYIVSLAISDLMVTLSCTWVHLAVTSS